MKKKYKPQKCAPSLEETVVPEEKWEPLPKEDEDFEE